MYWVPFASMLPVAASITQRWVLLQLLHLHSAVWLGTRPVVPTAAVAAVGTEQQLLLLGLWCHTSLPGEACLAGEGKVHHLGLLVLVLPSAPSVSEPGTLSGAAAAAGVLPYRPCLQQQ